jgi:hypothetical protein
VTGFLEGSCLLCLSKTSKCLTDLLFESAQKFAVRKLI